MNDQDLSEILADAERVSKSGVPPRFTRDQAESAMLALAKTEAREGEGTCNAYARLCQSDARMQKLYSLGQAADVAEARDALSKAAPEDRFYPLLMDLARMRKRNGETIEAACTRLLTEDPVVRDVYAATQGM